MEANKEEYFVDGFLIKHFGIFPFGFEKDNLFYEQRAFLVYLSGSIPSLENWSTQMDYTNRKEAIENLKVKDIQLSEEDLSLAKLHGKDTDSIKREQLKSEKDKRIKKLDEDFGIKNENDQKIVEFKSKSDNKERLWDMLQGKGLIDKDKE